MVCMVVMKNWNSDTEVMGCCQGALGCCQGCASKDASSVHGLSCCASHGPSAAPVPPLGDAAALRGVAVAELRAPGRFRPGVTKGQFSLGPSSSQPVCPKTLLTCCTVWAVTAASWLLRGKGKPKHSPMEGPLVRYELPSRHTCPAICLGAPSVFPIPAPNPMRNFEFETLVLDSSCVQTSLRPLCLMDSSSCVYDSVGNAQSP